ncbi:hypothetical protein BDY19DRAFT_908983 [Irpex rosettiformis]|uniref:Uncharacterized protein n=1 Tax=Irpex rosettiformis TaxID=378272 RepID=A0ACB8TUB2_9APHY|nr:hypothetical protein BDY19DRAFT_908983 [Irpex rosettiformis]
MYTALHIHQSKYSVHFKCIFADADIDLFKFIRGNGTSATDHLSISPFARICPKNIPLVYCKLTYDIGYHVVSTVCTDPSPTLGEDNHICWDDASQDKYQSTSEVGCNNRQGSARNDMKLFVRETGNDFLSRRKGIHIVLSFLLCGASYSMEEKATPVNAAQLYPSYTIESVFTFACPLVLWFLFLRKDGVYIGSYPSCSSAPFKVVATDGTIGSVWVTRGSSYATYRDVNNIRDIMEPA